jgi:UrcA family protein
MKTITILAALLAAAVTATPAAAQQPPARVAVSYADLDLATAADRRALDLRIVHAVNAACGEASPADLRGQSAARICRAELSGRAAAQLEVALAERRRGAAAILAAR